MTALDLVFIGLVLLFALLGYLSGFWMQVMRLLVLVGAYLLAGPVGKPLGPWLANTFEIPSVLGMVLGPAAAFMILYLIFSTVGWVVLRRLRRSASLRGSKMQTWDRAAGAALGGAKTFLILFVSLNAIVLLEKPMLPTLQKTGVGYERSFMVQFARGHNLLAGLHVPLVGNVEVMGKLASDPSYRDKLLADPKVKSLLEHPKLKGLFGDSEIVSASEKHDVAGLLSNPRLNEVLEDPQIRELFSEIDFDK